jgi:hypothetical protein
MGDRIILTEKGLDLSKQMKYEKRALQAVLDMETSTHTHTESRSSTKNHFPLIDEKLRKSVSPGLTSPVNCIDTAEADNDSDGDGEV